ncbi:MAG: type II/IV secretion system protein [Ramlibacter sp.]|nr:type II/IV secretion system protein [Ramlibacter sp.]MBX3660003.1 type II/IV secretion system protein [Ramlibacter sp.]MCW5650926.1 type II/IV secretion system protein [Ramlibacter sp.]
MSRELATLSPAEFCAELVKQGLLAPDQAEIVLTEHSEHGGAVTDIVSALGLLSAQDITALLSSASTMQAVRLADSVADPQALTYLPRNLAQTHGVLPLGFDPVARLLTVVTADAHDVVAMDQIRSVVPPDIQLEWRLATRGEVDGAIEQFYGQTLTIESILQGLRTGRIDDSGGQLRGPKAYAHPIVRLVDAILSESVRLGASDIHLEPEEGFLRLRYRIDGVLRQARVFHRQHWAPMLVRLKVMSNMDIAETRAPQDGRISMLIQGHDVDFRAAVQPTVFGENFVLRVLDRRRSIVPLDQMGLAPDRLGVLRLMLARPYGIVLVTGPTGSGKTTTLYSILNELNTEQVNIMTLEDPVEYPMPRIRQASAGDSSKLDFASGVRSMMRQDPDIILVGEIRDRDTAEMAFRAAMTGHQVFSTLHANSAVLSIPRLVDMGVTSDLITGNLIGIVAQRLVRRLCGDCKEAYDPSSAERLLLGLRDHGQATLYRPVGCARCGGAGYRGRMALTELLRFDETLDDMVAQGRRSAEILAHARQEGFSTMAEDGVQRVIDGVTSLEEVARVVDLTRIGRA